MARIKKNALSAEYAQAKDAAAATGDKNDCSVRAVATGCGISYEVAQATLAEMGRKKGEGAISAHVKMAIRHHGFNIVYLSPAKIIALYPHPHNTLQNVTTRHPQRFKKVWAEKLPERVIIETADHVVAVVDGRVHDWAMNHALRATGVWALERQDAGKHSEATQALRSGVQ